MNINVSESITATERVIVIHGSSFVTRLNGQFRLNDKRLRFVGVNKYPLLVSSMTQSQTQAFFTACAAKQIKVVRTWAFDSGLGGPLHKLAYPTNATNVITNPSFETDTSDWTLNANGSYPSDTVRSSDAAHDGSCSLKQTSNYNTYQNSYYLATVTPNTDYVWTFWYKVQAITGDGSHFPPSVRVHDGVTGTQFVDAGILDSSNVWTKFQLKFNSGSRSSVRLLIVNFGGQNISYYDDFHLGLAPTPVLETIEAGYAQMDMILNEARLAGVKLILSLHDSNENNYNSKHTYVSWINSTMGKGLTDSFPYSAFFTDTDVKALFKQHFLDLANRVNTINGRLYKTDDTIFSWEEGNEVRYNSGDPNINSLNSTVLTTLSKPGGWADEMSTYFKSVDPNHLVGFGGSTHAWEYIRDPGNNEDWIWNGTYTGVDYGIIAALPNIDYLDPHLYPTQNVGTQILNFGFKFGYTIANRGLGFDAQIIDYITKAKANGKPMILGEYGLEREPVPSNSLYPLYPRIDNFTRVFNTLFDNDGDGVVLWHGEIADAGSFSVNFTGSWNGNTSNLNWDDRPVAALIGSRNANFNALIPQGIDIDQAFGWVKGPKLR